MQENLARGLSVVSRAVSSRSTLPVLANVLLKTEDAGLKLTATNLEIGITYWVPGKIDEDGATTVPAKLLTDLVSSLPSGDKVELEVTAGDTLHVKAGRFQTHIKGIDADEFPAIQTAGDRPTTRVAQNVLRRALAETAFAAASEGCPGPVRVMKRFEKSTRPRSRPSGGVRTSLTNDETTLPNAAPMTMPTASSRTLPRMMNCLNSFSTTTSRWPAGLVTADAARPATRPVLWHAARALSMAASPRGSERQASRR